MAKSAQISGFDVAARNYKRLVQAVIDLGGGDDDMNRIYTNHELLSQIAGLIVGNATGIVPAGTVVATLEVVVDHDKSVEEMVKAGSYNFANFNLTDENFPHPRQGEETVIIDLVKFDKFGTTAERERQLAAYGDLAEMDDMLALGAGHPGQQNLFPIIFLGASWVHPNGDRNVGYLLSDSSERHCLLSLAIPEYRWFLDCVFAVRRRK